MEEKNSRERFGSGAQASSARHVARSAEAGGAKRSTGATRARGSAAGAARTSRPAAKSGSGARSASARSGARPASKGRAGASVRNPRKRRRPGARLTARDPRLWIIIGAFVVVIALAVTLALVLPGGPQRDDVAAPENEIGALTDEDTSLDSESVDGDAAPVDADAVPADGDAAPAEGEAASSDAASDVSAEQAEMMRKYQVLDGIPNTAQPLGLPETERVDDSYFDDALFVGDSVTRKLQQYVTYTRKHSEPNLMGQARFLAQQSFSARNALMMVSEKSIHPEIGGVKMTLEDAIAQLAPKKLYLMLGMNDVGVSGIEGALENMGKLLQRIKEKNPGMKIIVESATPRLKGTHPNTKQLFAFDVRLYDAILKLNDPDITFIDIAYVMRDAEGKLIAEYCDDPDNMAIHFTNAGCRQWIDYLYTHALS